MSKVPRVLAIITIVAGVVLIAAGSVTYYMVHRELADEKITVSDDAANLAGEPVEGPFTAYAEAMVIKEHASEIADGQTYAQLEQDDPRRESVMTSSFLRASLFTSVVAFGVAALVVGLGVLFILVGVAVMSLDKSVRARLDGADVAATAPVGAPVDPAADLPPPTTAPA